MVTEQLCHIDLGSGYWTSEPLSLYFCQVSQVLSFLKCEILICTPMHKALKSVSQERIFFFFSTKSTLKIQSFCWRAKVTLYNSRSVRFRVESHPWNRYLLLSLFPTATPLSLPNKRIQQIKFIDFINILKYFPSCHLFPMLFVLLDILKIHDSVPFDWVICSNH